MTSSPACHHADNTWLLEHVNACRLRDAASLAVALNLHGKEGVNGSSPGHHTLSASVHRAWGTEEETSRTCPGLPIE
jgi:hypothetical protein